MLKGDVKKVAEKCINYVDILSEKYPKNDILSEQIVRYYKAIINHTKYNDNDGLNVAMLLDKCVYAYFNDNKFNELVVEGFKNMDKSQDLGIFLISNYQTYKSDPQNQINTTRWI